MSHAGGHGKRTSGQLRREAFNQNQLGSFFNSEQAASGEVQVSSGSFIEEATHAKKRVLQERLEVKKLVSDLKQKLKERKKDSRRI